jgi:hypothetical protein
MLGYSSVPHLTHRHVYVVVCTYTLPDMSLLVSNFMLFTVIEYLQIYENIKKTGKNCHFPKETVIRRTSGRLKLTIIFRPELQYELKQFSG